MRAHWWSYVFGLLFMQTNRILSFMADPQDPSIIPLMKINASAEITCSTWMSGVETFSLHRYFSSNWQIVNLHLENGEINKAIIAKEYEDRLNIVPVQQEGRGLGFTLQFSFLGKDDIDVYVCSWTYFTPKGEQVTRSGKGTFIAPKEKDPLQQCNRHVTEHIFIVSSVLVFITLLIFTGTLIVKCNRFKKHFRPSRVETAARPRRPPPVPVQHSSHHHPYLITSVTSFEDGYML